MVEKQKNTKSTWFQSKDPSIPSFFRSFASFSPSPGDLELAIDHIRDRLNHSKDQAVQLDRRYSIEAPGLGLRKASHSGKAREIPLKSRACGHFSWGVWRGFHWLPIINEYMRNNKTSWEMFGVAWWSMVWDLALLKCLFVFQSKPNHGHLEKSNLRPTFPGAAQEDRAGATPDGGPSQWGAAAGSATAQRGAGRAGREWKAEVDK